MSEFTNLDLRSYTAFPPDLINAYVKAQLERFGIVIAKPDSMGPIFPTAPSNIDDVYKNYINSPQIGTPLYMQYERMLRFRPSTFYRHKREQLMYYLYCANQPTIFDANRVITEALDREDSAAQDVNTWLAENPVINGDGSAVPHNIFFHRFRVYQADESRDVVELASARTVYANKLIVEYDYHTKDYFDQSGKKLNPYD